MLLLALSAGCGQPNQTATTDPDDDNADTGVTETGIAPPDADDGADGGPSDMAGGSCWQAEVLQLRPDGTLGAAAGFSATGDHFVRQSAVSCEHEFSPPVCNDGPMNCNNNCNGERCVEHLPGRCSCSCASDADCPTGQACLCPFQAGLDGPAVAVQGPRCISAECQTSADCPSAMDCGLSLDDCGVPLGLFCHRDNDECGNDCDCDEDQYCWFSRPTNRWECAWSAGECLGN
jgi:hypothetical protein